MDTYGLEIFKYLTIPKNYVVAKQIAERIYSVDEQLKSEFWETVEDVLKKKVSPKFQFDSDDANFYIYKATWQDTSVALEKGTLDFGVCLTRMLFEIDPVVELAKQLPKELPNLESGNKDWLCWQKIDNVNTYRFNQSETLIRILPESRDVLVNEFVEFVLNYLQELESFCDAIQRYHMS